MDYIADLAEKVKKYYIIECSSCKKIYHPFSPEIKQVLEEKPDCNECKNIKSLILALNLLLDISETVSKTIGIKCYHCDNPAVIAEKANTQWEKRYCRNHMLIMLSLNRSDNEG